MPKIKTHKGAASRFRVTGGGKIMRMYGSRNNFRRKKRKPVRVKMGRTVPVSASQSRTIREMLGK
ncbi:MAG: 50S ribosomal protein L35 [Dehalococcoidia bacterium]|nr:50S ribosomal protein L35 [Dehalococcoidia bacterium]HCV00279.1 50S ribosomal protein L35 [Dehalococcoidia bacterium]